MRIERQPHVTRLPWWSQPRLWRDGDHQYRLRSHADDLRETEIAALARLRRHADALTKCASSAYRATLTDLERTLHDLDIKIMTSGDHPALRTQLDRARHIAETHPDLGMGPRHINAILDEVVAIMRDFVELEEMEAQPEMLLHEVWDEMRASPPLDSAGIMVIEQQFVLSPN